MKTKKTPAPRPVAKKPSGSLNLSPKQAQLEENKLREFRETLESPADEPDTSARSDLIGRD